MAALRLTKLVPPHLTMETSRSRIRSVRILVVSHGRALPHSRMYYQNKTLRRTTQPLGPMKFQPGRATVRCILFFHGFHAFFTARLRILRCHMRMRIQKFNFSGSSVVGRREVSRQTPLPTPQSTFQTNADSSLNCHISRRMEECLGGAWPARNLACIRVSNLPFLNDHSRNFYLTLAMIV